MDSQTKSPLDQLNPKQIFLFGVVEGILVLCTIGFFILLGLVLKGGVSFAGTNGGNAPTAVPTVNPSAGDTGPVVVAPVDAKTDHILGNKNAKVTLVEYSDFECPFCGRFYPTVKQAMQNFSGKIRLVYRHFPLTQIHPEAEPAAMASECADEQGKFWEFHDKLFENQTQLGSAYYSQVARDLGLNVTKFSDCLSTKKYLQKVQSQAATGDAAGVRGTPHTLVVGPNGEVVPISGAQPYSALEAAIKRFVD